MILADTNIWADHLGPGDPVLADLLHRGRIVIHPFIIAEIALGNLRNRAGVLRDLRTIKQALVVHHNELLVLIERQALTGSGVGFVDAHLIGSVLAMPGTSLWTRDKRLVSVAERLGVAARPVN